MQLIYILFLISISPDGDFNAAYSTYPDQTQCESSLSRVALVFEENNVKTAYQGCVTSTQAFTPFQHGVPEDAPVFTTLNIIKGNALSVKFLENQEACKNTQKSIPSSWCAQTHQSFLR